MPTVTRLDRATHQESQDYSRKAYYQVTVDPGELECTSKALPYSTYIGTIDEDTLKVHVWTPAASVPRGYRVAAAAMLGDVAESLRLELEGRKRFAERAVALQEPAVRAFLQDLAHAAYLTRSGKMFNAGQLYQRAFDAHHRIYNTELHCSAGELLAAFWNALHVQWHKV